MRPLNLLLIIVLIVITAAVGGGAYYVSQREAVLPNQTNGTSVGIQSTEDEDSLQLGAYYPPTNTPKPTSPLALQFPSPTPTIVPGDPCNHDNGIPVNSGQELDDVSCYCVALIVTCRNKACVSAKGNNGVEIGCGGVGYADGIGSVADLWCRTPALAGDGDGVYCIGKPIIYLYPETETLVDVSIQTDGDIFVSDPLYPYGGWKDVLAKPNGELTYQSKQYRELFYETNATDIRQPKTGLIVEKKQVKPILNKILDQLGLTEWEKQEFLEYWLPRLDNLNSPYVFISFIEPLEKNRIDKVIVNPEPDTRIEFLAYFKPLMHKSFVYPLLLPEKPARRGFVMVEWGGTIDTNSQNFYLY